MIRFFTRRGVAQMKRRYHYDASYLNDVAEVSGGAAIRLGMLPLFSQYSAGVPAELWAGTAIGSTLDGDCGPCLQLVVDVALERDVAPEKIRAALSGDWRAAGAVGLALRFARASISDTAELDNLRHEIVAQYGKRAVTTLAIAAATGRSWPVIKRALGHGSVCQKVQVDSVVVDVIAHAETKPQSTLASTA